MRFVVGVWLCLGAGGISAALADPVTPPTTPAATSAPAPSTEPKQAAPAPAAEAKGSMPAADAKSATPAVDAKSTVVVQGKAAEDLLEKYFLAEGYKLEMHNGEKVFCRREDQLGTHLGGHKICGTAEQLRFTEQEAKAAYQRGHTQQNNPVYP